MDNVHRLLYKKQPFGTNMPQNEYDKKMIFILNIFISFERSRLFTILYNFFANHYLISRLTLSMRILLHVREQ